MYEASKSRKIQIMEVLQYVKNGKYLQMLKTKVVILETQMIHRSVDEKVSLLVRNVSEIRKGAKHLNSDTRASEMARQGEVLATKPMWDFGVYTTREKWLQQDVL